MPELTAFPPWTKAPLPEPPSIRGKGWAALLGPGLLMAGANIGAGEWLMGPLLTARFGGSILWLATTSIALQVCYNLAVMRYALFCGESIFVGFFRTWPGPMLWLPFYVVLDAGSYLPYAANAASVPLVSWWKGRALADLPEDVDHLRMVSYGLFALAFVPLIFGGKIYTALERVMTVKLALVLAYLTCFALFFVSWKTKAEVLSGFVAFGAVPPGVEWAKFATLAAFAGAGGLTNTAFSSYARDKGWGMGAVAGAIPSAVGGRAVQLSHGGATFDLTPVNLGRWRGWMLHLLRDQCLLWAPACLLGMALPSMLSLEFVRGGTSATGNAVGTVAAFAIREQLGPVLWAMTLACGFLIVFSTQITNADGCSRRWTDILWIGLKPLRKLGGHKAKHVYYTVLSLYAAWGAVALWFSPNPLVLTVLNGVLMTLGMGVSALHVIWVCRALLPRPARLPLLVELGLIGCAVFYCGLSWLSLRENWTRIVQWMQGG